MITIHHYPSSAAPADCLRAGGGIALTALPLLVAQPATPVTAVLLCALAVFALDLLRILRQPPTTIRLTDDGVVTLGGRARRIRWSDLSRMTLAYYSTRRDGANGWLLLTLVGAEGRLVVDSRVDGFDRIVARSAAAARLHRLAIDETTRSNLDRMGVEGAIPSARCVVR